MSLEDEARTLRSRVAAIQDAMDRLGSDSSDGNPAMLVETFDDGSYPTTPGKFFAAHPADAGGVEEEDGDVSVPVSGGTVYVAVLGTKTPPVGTKLMARSIGGRWAAVYNGPED